MDSQTLLLLLAGSFLPNNIMIWGYKWVASKLKRSKKPVPKLRLVSPRAYYAKFESDPKTQYAYHRKMVLFWLINFIPMNVIVAFDIWATLGGHDKLALLMTAVLLAINTNYSLYANFDTETGDAHAAYASLRTDEIKNGQTQILSQDEVQEIVDQLTEHEQAELAAAAIS